MRIAIIATLYPPYILGGAEYSTRLLVRAWVQLGHDVLVITTSDHEEQEVLDGACIERLKNRNIYWRYPQRDKSLIVKSVWHAVDTYLPLYASSAERILRTFHPDVVVTGNLCGISPTIWKTCHSMQIPVVHTLRDYYLLCPVQTMTKHGVACGKQCAVCRAYSINKQRMSQYVDAVVGISNSILNKHISHNYFANARIRQVIPNSVEAKHGEEHPLNKIIGYMGRLSPEKGVELLIEAFAESDACNQYVLQIAGRGNEDYTRYLQKRFDSNNVQFVGQQDSATFLKNIDLLVVPSMWDEPFGRVVIEAYAAHCPVIISNRGAFAELSEEGISWMFDTDNPRTLTVLLNRFVRGDLHIQQQQFERVLAKYNEQNVAQQYIDLFENLLR